MWLPKTAAPLVQNMDRKAAMTLALPRRKVDRTPSVMQLLRHSAESVLHMNDALRRQSRTSDRGEENTA